MSNNTPNIDYVDLPIRSENPGIQSLQVVVRDLRDKLPGDLKHQSPIVLGKTPKIYIIVGGFLLIYSI